jgi:hypothetical protein
MRKRAHFQRVNAPPRRHQTHHADDFTKHVHDAALKRGLRADDAGREPHAFSRGRFAARSFKLLLNPPKKRLRLVGAESALERRMTKHLNARR